MALNPAQQQTLKTYIDSVPEWAALPHNADTAFFIRDALAEPAAPAFVVWRTSVTQDEIMLNGFDWTRVDNLSVGPARVWEWLFSNAARSINPSKPNVRAGIEAVWKGVQADLLVRAAVYTHCKRNASKVEKLFATGPGTMDDPATMTVEGAISYWDVQQARDLP